MPVATPTPPPPPSSSSASGPSAGTAGTAGTARSRSRTSGTATGADEPPLRKLYRSADGRMLGGVARGLAGHLGLPVGWVRLVFLALFLAQGLGALLYAIFWIVVPLGVGGAPTGSRPLFETTTDGRRRLRKPDRGQTFALIALFVVGSIFVAGADLGRSGAGNYIWPTLLIGAGVVLVWRQADNARREQWASLSTDSRRRRTFQ
ncbi:PspC domain-containing protein, partial [Streptomyces niveus]